MMKGWAIPAGPSRSRQWHYFQPDTALFPRWRSACEVHLLFGDPHLVDTIGATHTLICSRCELLAPPLPAARAAAARDASCGPDVPPSGITARAASVPPGDPDACAR